MSFETLKRLSRVYYGIYWELMEGIRTEKLSSSNLHKLSKSSFQKRIKSFLILYLYYNTKRSESPVFIEYILLILIYKIKDL